MSSAEAITVASLQWPLESRSLLNLQGLGLPHSCSSL